MVGEDIIYLMTSLTSIYLYFIILENAGGIGPFPLLSVQPQEYVNAL